MFIYDIYIVGKILKQVSVKSNRITAMEANNSLMSGCKIHID